MLFVPKDHLKPGMVLSKDIVVYSNNLCSLLLSKGQVLNNTYINKILFHNIPGVYIVNDAFNDIDIEPVISESLEAKALDQIESVFSQFKNSTSKLKRTAINEISTIVDDLIIELMDKKQLANNIIEFRNYDDYTYQHCLNVSILAVSTGISLGLTQHMLHELCMAGMLHDIGKIFIPLEIINKKGKLTDEEFEIMKAHPVNAYKLLQHLVSYDVLRGIENHHEKLDGTGYPYGRKGKNISLYGKILAVCDVYDALTSDRAYRKTIFPSEVIEYIMAGADSHFDFNILSNFLKNIVAYPLGTFVRLSNDKIGVVINNHSENIMRPAVRIINNDNTTGEDIDLLHNRDYMNVTIIGMGYDYSNINYNKIAYHKNNN
jgi:HD-GYP domain-containing protein (c-di-GMP phosphodiesterase class II)